MKRNTLLKYLGNQSGLTLIELVVVLIILGLLAGIVFQAVIPRVDEAKVQTTRTQMEILALALDTYRLDMGEYPANLEELIQASSEKWKGPYLKKKRIPKDGWGNEYVYQVTEGGMGFDIYSTGDAKQEIHYDEVE